MDYSQYQPGVCNIGGAEVARRRRVAQLGAFLFLAFSAVAIIAPLSSSVAVFAFIPALIASIGFVQSKKKFCLAFGLMGTFNFAELGKISKVASPQEIASDRRQALLIILQSLGLALFATGLLLYIIAR